MATNYTTKLTCNTTQHDNALQKSASQVYKYNKSIDSAKGAITKFAGNIAKFAGALGIATGAMATFKASLTATEAGTDALGRTMRVVKTSVDSFMSSLTNGTGIVNFLNNMNDIKKAAVEAYNALDDLDTGKMWKQSRIEKLRADIAEDRVIVMSASTSAKDKKAAQERIKVNEDKIKALNGEIMNLLDDAYYSMIKELAGTTDLDKKTMDWLMNSRENGGGAIRARIAELEKQYKTEKTYVNDGTSITGASFGHYDYTWRKGAEWAEKWVSQMKRFSNATDEQIQAILNQRNEINQIRQQQAAEQQKNNRVADKKVFTPITTTTSATEDEKTALEQLQEELKKLSREKEMLVGKDGYILDKDQWDELNKKIKETEQAIERIKYLISPNLSINIEAGEMSTYDDYENAIKVMESANLQASEIIGGANTAIYGSIKDISNAMESLIGVFEQWENISDGDADFADYFRAITSSIFTTIDAITSIIQAINLISTTATAVKTAQALIDASVTKANLAEMASKVVAFYAELGPLGLAPASATIAAYSAMAKIGAFASGGIVGGSSYVGDNNLARVNAGEMILNGTQQARLFKMLNGIGTNRDYFTNDVVFHISGSDLVGTINNYTNKKGRVY